MNQSHVVIVGGGFAGLECAIELAAHKDIGITLLDRNNYQQFQPLLYQVATSILSPTNAAFALRDILRDHSNVDVQMDEIRFDRHRQAQRHHRLRADPLRRLSRSRHRFAG